MSSASSYSNLVQELYVAYFGRPADYFGLQNFEAALAAANAPTDPAALATAYSSNATIKSLVDSFGTSAESTALYGTGSTESFVNAIFENLFNRPAAVAGLNFWVNAIETGQVSKGDAALAILSGAESNTTTQGQSDWTLIQNKIAVATNFTTDLGSSSTEIVAYSGAAAAQQARLLLAGVSASTDPTTYNVQTTINNIVAGNNNNSYDLTAGVDTLTGGTGNNVFNAILDNSTGLSAGGQATTLQSFDTITGGTLNNTLNITDFGQGAQMVLPSGATITGITTVNVSSLEGIGSAYSTPLDFSTLGTAMTNVNINASSGDDYVKVSDTTALSVTDSNDDDVYTFGGSTVTVNNNSAAGSYGNYVEVQGGAATTAVTINNGYDEENYIYDLNESSSKANTIATVTINNQVDYDTYIYSNALTQLNLTGITYHYVYDYGTTGTRTLNVALNNDGNASGYSGDYWYLETDAAALAVTTAGKSSTNAYFYAPDATSITFNDAVDMTFYDGKVAGSDYFEASSAKSVTISGAGAFTADLSGLNAAAVINASASTGAITVELASGGGQSFTGGTGQDIITVGAAQTATVTAGSATNNEIILANAPGATEADLADYSHFSILGVSGSTSGVFDMSKATGYKSFDVQGSGGNVTFTNVATGATLSLENGNSHIVTLQTADSTGQSDSTTVTLGTSTAEGNNYAQVTLEDSIFVGIGTVNLVSNVANSGSENYLGNLFDNNWVTLNVSGTGTVEIGTSLVNSTALTINNTAVNNSTTSLYIDSLTDNHLATLTIAGSSGVDIDTLSSTSTTLAIVDNNTAFFYIGTLGDTALTSATFTNSVNTTGNLFEIGGTLTEAKLATLTLNGNVELSVSGDTLTTGITVTGSTDNAAVHFTSSGITASGSTDSITLGNGTDTVVLGAGASGSTQTVVLGSGANDTVTTTSVGAVNVTVGSATTGTDSITADSALSLHVTAGNGTNVISDTAAGASTTITVGTGVNTITVGDGASGSISFGAHTTGVDAVTIGVSGTSLTAIEKISGLNNAGNDTLTFSGDANALTFTQVTAANVSSDGGDTTLLADWVKAADGDNGIVTGAAHTVTWFQFQGNTYLLESAAGQTADGGTMAAGNTLVELVGTSYTFAHATSSTTAGGVVHLVG